MLRKNRDGNRDNKNGTKHSRENVANDADRNGAHNGSFDARSQLTRRYDDTRGEDMYDSKRPCNVHDRIGDSQQRRSFYKNRYGYDRRGKRPYTSSSSRDNNNNHSNIDNGEKNDLVHKLMTEKVERLEADLKISNDKLKESENDHQKTKDLLQRQTDEKLKVENDLKLARDQVENGQDGDAMKQLFNVRKQNLKLWQKLEDCQLSERAATRRNNDLREQMNAILLEKEEADKRAEKRVLERFEWEKKILQRRLAELGKNYQEILDRCNCGVRDFKYRGLNIVA